MPHVLDKSSNMARDIAGSCGHSLTPYSLEIWQQAVEFISLDCRETPFPALGHDWGPGLLVVVQPVFINGACFSDIDQRPEQRSEVSCPGRSLAWSFARSRPISSSETYDMMPHINTHPAVQHTRHKETRQARDFRGLLFPQQYELHLELSSFHLFCPLPACPHVF